MDIDDKLAKLASQPSATEDLEDKSVDSLPKRPAARAKAGLKAPKIQSQVQRMRQRPKPLLEGINTPVKTFSDIQPTKSPVQQEVAEPTESFEPKLLPETEAFDPRPTEPLLLTRTAIAAANKGKSHKGLWLLFIIFIILAGGYFWAAKKAASYQPKLVWSYFTRPNNKQVYQNQQPDDAVTTSVLPVQPRTDIGDMGTATVTPEDLATSTPSSTPVFISTGSPATIEVAPQLTIKPTPTGYLNVRTQPSSSAKVIVQVHPGETYSYTQSKSGWYLISLPSGQTGWVSGQYVTTQ